ncbi:MAG: DUF58 domain-containing protein [Gemmatimonadetes bacterium]|nr:DUF58 domain-containing protein [Gemmatimonadota bacterium]
MIIPSRRWFVGAALLALVAPLALLWSGAATLLIVLDVAWVVLLAIDAWRAWSVTADDFSVQRDAPPAFSMGRSLPVSYRWQSRRSRPMQLLVVEELPPILSFAGGGRRLLLLAPDAPLYERHDVRPLARGKGGEGTLHLRVLSPWGLAWRALTVPLPWQVTVFPTLVGASLRALPTQSQRRREAGLRNVRRLGEGRVFESLREWVPGDDTRTIDWKATARRGKPMARQFEDERRQQVLIAIDAGRMLTAESEGRARPRVGDRGRVAAGACRRRPRRQRGAARLCRYRAAVHRPGARASGTARDPRRAGDGARDAGRAGLSGRLRLPGPAQPQAGADRRLHRRHRPHRERGPGGAGRVAQAAARPAGRGAARPRARRPGHGAPRHGAGRLRAGSSRGAAAVA